MVSRKTRMLLLWWWCFFLFNILVIVPCHCDTGGGSSSSSSFKNDNGNEDNNNSEQFSVLANAINDCISARCGHGVNNDNDNNGHAIWVYEGALFDPLDGRRVATVEGIELVRSLSSIQNCDNPQQIQKYLTRCRPLQIAKYLKEQRFGSTNGGNENKDNKDNNSNNAHFDSLSTILSRKLFVYKSPNNPHSILKSIKLHPNSPQRNIPTNQAVVCYDTASSYVTRNYNELIVHSEWPDGKVLWGKAILETGQTKPTKAEKRPKIKMGPIQALDFTIYTRRRSRKGKGDKLDFTAIPPQPPDYITSGAGRGSSSGSNSSKMKKKPSSSSAAYSSPRRSKLIQFGQSGFDETNKFGARETYSYNIGRSSSGTTRTSAASAAGSKKRPSSSSPSSSSCTLKYTRYGEAPPFYGPGRLCTLELQGRRIDDHELVLGGMNNNNPKTKKQEDNNKKKNEKIPALLQSMIKKKQILPEFFSVLKPISTQDDELAQSIVRNSFGEEDNNNQNNVMLINNSETVQDEQLLQVLDADFYYSQNPTMQKNSLRRTKFHRFIRTQPKMLLHRLIRSSSIQSTNSH